ncbi:hypothetical protein [Carboxylicivirga sp. RSCT41]|uniref:hypothetical protein n=1 Tax=Carboxylicivirga agarovorans TaxID=3417570 RepID=UPI003D3595AC
MNFRKLLSLLNYLSLLALIYIAINNPEDCLSATNYLFGGILTLELLYFGYEYLNHLRPNGKYLLEERQSVDTDRILYTLIVIPLVITIFVQWNKFTHTNDQLFVFTTLTTIRGLFNNQRNSLRIDSEMIFFSDLFKNDLWIKEIKSAIINSESKSIELTLNNMQKRTLKLSRSFFKNEKERIEHIVDQINLHR